MALRHVAGVVLWALVSIATPAQASLVTFDFEELSPGEYQGSLVTNGFALDPGRVDSHLPSHYHITDLTSMGWGANNGTKAFVFDYFFVDSVLNVYSSSGGLFGVEQFDLAPNVWPGTAVCRSDSVVNQCGVTFTGYVANGDVISRFVSLDPTLNAAGLNVFQTFIFDEHWDGLTRFSIVADDALLNPGLDNLVLSRVPEPPTIALVGVGLLGAIAARRRRVQKSG